MVKPAARLRGGSAMLSRFALLYRVMIVVISARGRCWSGSASSSAAVATAELLGGIDVDEDLERVPDDAEVR